MVEFRLADSKSDFLAQKNIWKLCFGDEDNFIKQYYENFYNKTEVMLAVVDSEIAAMLTMLPAHTVTAEGIIYNTPCLYAIATAPDKQGKGIASELIAQANKYLKNTSAMGTILVPASEGLFSFYEKRGYKAVYSINEINLKLEDIPDNKNSKMMVANTTPERYNLLRKEYLEASLFVDYCNDEIAYQKFMSKYSSGGIVAINKEDVWGCAAVECYGAHVMVKEILMSEALLSESMSAIAKFYSGERYTFRMPPQSGKEFGAVTRKFAMINWFDDKLPLSFEQQEGYMGFGFD